jgi:uncharacterized protein (TIGR02246 family)
MTDTTVAERAAATIVGRLVDAWNAHDADAFARCFAEDADFTNVFGMHAKGRAAIAGFHAPIFTTMFKDSRLAARETRVRTLHSDIAAVDLRWAMTGARGPDGTPWPERRGLINMVLAREGGEWSIAVMHNMDLPPEEMAEAQAAVQKAAG